MVAAHRLLSVLRSRGTDVEKGFVPILYQVPAFDAFDDFSDFAKSITYADCKTCQ